MKKIKSSVVFFLTALLLCVSLTTSSGAIDAYAASAVFSGKDGWYFITSDSTIQDYQGTNLYTPQELSLILMNHLNMRDTLAANGIEFVVLLVPNKEHIYNEYMPDTYGQLAPYTRIQQVYDLLRDQVKVVYPEEMLREAKEKYPYDLYYRTDPHWNGIGTYLCSRLLMEEIGVEMPALEDVTITPYTTDNLDCAQMLGRKLPDIGYNVSGYGTDEPSGKRVFICGDSFGLEVSECIDPVVDDCIIVHRDIFEPAMPYIWGADVLVLEVVERFMDGIPIYSVVTPMAR